VPQQQLQQQHQQQKHNLDATVPAMVDGFEGDDESGALIGPAVKAFLQRLPTDSKSLLFQSAKLRCLAALLLHWRSVDTGH